MSCHRHDWSNASECSSEGMTVTRPEHLEKRQNCVKIATYGSKWFKKSSKFNVSMHTHYCSIHVLCVCKQRLEKSRHKMCRAYLWATAPHLVDYFVILTNRMLYNKGSRFLDKHRNLLPYIKFSRILPLFLKQKIDYKPVISQKPFSLFTDSFESHIQMEMISS